MNVPLRVRLALVFAASFAALLIAGAGVLFWQFRRQLIADFDHSLAISAESARLLFLTDRAEQGTVEGTLVHIISELAFGDRTLVAFDAAGQRLAMSQPTRSRPHFADAPADAPTDHAATVALGAGRARVLGVQVEGGARIVIAMSTETFERQLDELGAIMLALLPVVLVAGGGLGAWGAGIVLRPVRRVASLADEVGRAAQSGQVSFSKLPEPRGTDEIGTVTTAFNHLVDRTSAAIARERRVAEEQRSFLADAAHELRTPVAIIRNEAEVALSSPEGDRAMAASLGTIASESERLGELVADLLFLARGSDPSDIAQTRVFLDDLANNAVARVRKLPDAAGRSIRWTQCEAAPVKGSPALLERAIVALLHNALIHGRGAPIEIGAGTTGDRAWVRVRDHGPGITPADRERVFQRFVRLSPSAGGTGLGLPIARTIALHHGGSVDLEESGPGASFLLSVPADRA